MVYRLARQYVLTHPKSSDHLIEKLQYANYLDDKLHQHTARMPN